MKDVLELIVKNIISDENGLVEIAESKNDGFYVFEVRVKKEKIGDLIGKNGRTAKAIRNIMRATANRRGEKCSIEFVEV